MTSLLFPDTTCLPYTRRVTSTSSDILLCLRWKDKRIPCELRAARLSPLLQLSLPRRRLKRARADGLAMIPLCVGESFRSLPFIVFCMFGLWLMLLAFVFPSPRNAFEFISRSFLVVWHATGLFRNCTETMNVCWQIRYGLATLGKSFAVYDHFSTSRKLRKTTAVDLCRMFFDLCSAVDLLMIFVVFLCYFDPPRRCVTR
jgi:hypothetical protein